MHSESPQDGGMNVRVTFAVSLCRRCACRRRRSWAGQPGKRGPHRRATNGCVPSESSLPWTAIELLAFQCRFSDPGSSLKTAWLKEHDQCPSTGVNEWVVVDSSYSEMKGWPDKEGG